MSQLILPDWLERQFNQGREFRRMATPLQVRANDDQENKDGWDVEGYATTFDQWYTLAAWNDYEVQECVDRKAFDSCDMSDFIMQYDHHGRVFARNRNKTLTAEPDDHGLRTLAKLRGTTLGREILEEVQGGYSDRMSFAFVVKKDKREVVEDHETGKVLVKRTILEISKLYDVSIVSIPANDATEISARGLADGSISWAAQELRAYEDRRRAYLWLQLQLRLKGANS